MCWVLASRAQPAETGTGNAGTGNACAAGTAGHAGIRYGHCFLMKSLARARARSLSLALSLLLSLARALSPSLMMALPQPPAALPRRRIGK